MAQHHRPSKAFAKGTKMKLRSNVPIVTTTKLALVKQFYIEHLGFEVTFDSDEFLGLRSASSPEVELGFMAPEPGEPEYSGGMTFGMVVDDPDAEHARLQGRGLTIARPLQDNPWGDRSFAVMDPVGVALYINKPIPPSPEYAKHVRS